LRPCSKKNIADPGRFSLNGFYNAGAKYYTNSNTSNDWTFYWSSAQALDVLVGLYLRKSSDAVKARIGGAVYGGEKTIYPGIRHPICLPPINQRCFWAAHGTPRRVIAQILPFS